MNREDEYKLTAKDAITVLQNLKDWLYFSSMNGGAAIPREAIDIAIRALEQPKAGKWIRDGHHIRCDQCGMYMCDTDREGDRIPTEFCPSCGAKMER